MVRLVWSVRAVLLYMILTCTVPCSAQRYCVILAGGNGERLWPLSNSTSPKQLLSVDDHGTLLEQSIDRVEGVVPAENIWLCVTQTLHYVVNNLVGDRVGRIVVEPDKRDTAPAILYSCLAIQKEDPDAVILFTAADAYIPTSSYGVYRSYIEKFYAHAPTHNDITIFGLRPTYPATGYGYIEYNTLSERGGFFTVTKFHEKPSESTAKGYLECGTMLWNIGMFGGAVSSFVREFCAHAPDVFDAVYEHVRDGAPYSAIRKVSVDYAVLEKSNHITVLPVAFPWCDVGNVRVFLSLQENLCDKQTRVVQHEAHNNLVSAPGLVALVGVKNLCVVQKDGILLIVHQDAAEGVKQVVAQCKENSDLRHYI